MSKQPIHSQKVSFAQGKAGFFRNEVPPSCTTLQGSSGWVSYHGRVHFEFCRYCTRRKQLSCWQTNEEGNNCLAALAMSKQLNQSQKDSFAQVVYRTEMSLEKSALSRCPIEIFSSSQIGFPFLF